MKRLNLTPSREELKRLADLGYSFSRIAMKYDRSIRFIKSLATLYPDIYAQIADNGKKRSNTWGKFGV
jgi:hypothetical protein